MKPEIEQIPTRKNMKYIIEKSFERVNRNQKIGSILHLIELIIIVALAIGVVGEGLFIYNLYQAKPSVEIVEVVNDDPFADLPTVPKETIKGLK